MAALVTEPLVGQTLAGKYTIRCLIGRGGVGVVYLATERGTEREVVVKCLAEHWLTDAEAVARFEREARRLDSLRHPNIVTMCGFERADGRAFLVMEYVRGRLLSDYISAHGRLTFEAFVPIAAQILKGMGYAHSRETMIRDVKPSNVMLCERKGRANFVKILDFGLAKLLRGETRITEEHVIGTAGYLAPEALKGERGDLRVDVYAAGVLFYEMLSGHLPFEGSSDASVFYKTVNEAPVHLRERLPLGHGVPDPLIALIHSCLEKDPARRPADANIVVEQLIDAVPSSLFRLPRVGESGASTSSSSGSTSLVGNTGVLDLMGLESWSRDTAPITQQVPVTHETPPHRLPGIALGAFIGAALLLVGGAVALRLDLGRPNADLPEDGSQAVPLAAREAPPVEESETTREPTPAFEPNAPPANDERAGRGIVMFESSPVAQLTIDGEARGTTPFRASLPVGEHSIRLFARGYEPWESVYEVLPADNEPILVSLLELAEHPTPRRESPRPEMSRSVTSREVPSSVVTTEVVPVEVVPGEDAPIAVAPPIATEDAAPGVPAAAPAKPEVDAKEGGLMTPHSTKKRGTTVFLSRSDAPPSGSMLTPRRESTRP